MYALHNAMVNEYRIHNKSLVTTQQQKYMKIENMDVS